MRAQHHRGAVRAAWLLPLLLVAACGRPRSPDAGPVALAVDVLADSGRSQRLVIDTSRLARPGATEPRPASVWLARVSPARAPAIEAPLPEPAPQAPEPDRRPPGLEIDEDLKPPLLRSPAPLVAPRGARGSVELDVRVDEEGIVSDAAWAGGSRDSTLVEAATACALGMRFYPALQSGRPVAVWCRQRFDFSGR